MPKQPKPKAPKLSKEQIAMRMAQEQEATRFKNLIRDQLFPVLQSVENIAEAKALCEVMAVVINGSMNKHWEGKTVKDLDLLEELNADASAEDKEIYEAAIRAVEELSIGDALKLLKGMGGTLDGFSRKIAEDTKMDDVKIEQIIAV